MSYLSPGIQAQVRENMCSSCSSLSLIPVKPSVYARWGEGTGGLKTGLKAHDVLHSFTMMGFPTCKQKSVREGWGLGG